MPNHFHMRLRTRNTPIALVVRQLLSSYAGRVEGTHLILSFCNMTSFR
jgi:hypothetical protein